MHFFYLDESGDTGSDLRNSEQPILVLGGISVKDTGWTTTQSRYSDLVNSYFGGSTPDGFELHAMDLLSPNGDGPFAEHPMERRTDLALAVLDLVAERGHGIHFVGIDKATLLGSDCATVLGFDSQNAWLLAYDYQITYINWYVKERLGHNSRGMIIHDDKPSLHDAIERIATDRRFTGPRTHRVKWVVEFSYPVDSRKNPMIQISDLVVYCARRFLEIENGYRAGWTADTKAFYAKCFRKIDDRVARKSLVQRGGRELATLNAHLERTRSAPRPRWRSAWGLS